MHAIADNIEAVFRLCLDVLPMRRCHALQRDKVQRQRRILGVRGACLEMRLPIEMPSEMVMVMKTMAWRDCVIP